VRIYFAHPLQHFQTDYEAGCIQEITDQWPGSHLINPADPRHRENYSDLINMCQLLVAVPYIDGFFSMTVFQEADYAAHRRIPTFQLTPEGIRIFERDLISPLSIRESRERIEL